MATLKCGMFSFVFKYERYYEGDDYEDYTYSLKLRMGNYHLFSDAIEKHFLSRGGKIRFTSDDEDYLLNAFKKFVDESNTQGEEIDYGSEEDGPQQIIIKLRKSMPPYVTYYITIVLIGDSFLECLGVGRIQLTTHTSDPEEIRRFVRKLEGEREVLRRKSHHFLADSRKSVTFALESPTPVRRP